MAARRVECRSEAEVWAVPIPSRAEQHALTHDLLAAVRGGRPHASIAHTRGLGLVAVAERPVGVDVEALRPRPTLARVVARLVPEAARVGDERELYALWCEREAWAKAHGVELWRSRGAPVAAERLDVGAGFAAALVVLG